MIDLHCHMLPAIDDGAPDWDTAMGMARMAVEDGIFAAACTPHIYPGLYENTAAGIRAGAEAFRERLALAGIGLKIVHGADVHLVPDLLEGLRAGRIATLNDTGYLLLEPPHHVAPPRLEHVCFGLQAAGYVPVITHPERLTWIGDHYASFHDLARQGVWMQVTAGSLTGRFGPEALYYAERMLDEGIVHVLATDAHDLAYRPPLLAEGRLKAQRWVGAAEAERLVLDRPRAVLDGVDPARITPPPGLANPGDDGRVRARRSLWNRLFGGRRSGG